MKFLAWLRTVKPGEAMKWGGVVFAYALAILILISIILTMIGQYS